MKDRLLRALIELAGQNDCQKPTATELIARSGVARASFYRNFKTVDDVFTYGIERMTQRYHEGKTFAKEDFHNREVMLYKFQFYKENAGIVLAFHRAKASTTLLELIIDCEIDACGDMPANSIARYELYYFSGAFYTMMINWLESGAQETPEAMADEFVRIANKTMKACGDRAHSDKNQVRKRRDFCARHGIM